MSQSVRHVYWVSSDNTSNFSGFVWSSLRADEGLIHSNTFNRTKNYNHFFLPAIVIITSETQFLPSLIKEIVCLVGRNSKQGASEKITRDSSKIVLHVFYTLVFPHARLASAIIF